MNFKAFDKQLNTVEDLKPSNIPFVTMIIGQRGSGKTTLLLNMVFDLYHNKFDDVYIISPTYRSDEKLQLLETKEFLTKDKNKKTLKSNGRYFKYFEENKDENKRSMNPKNAITDVTKAIDFIENLKAERMKIDKKKMKDILLIIDDCLGSKFIKSNELKMFICNSRHIKCSIIISSQAYKSIEKTIRLNTTYLILFPTANMSELSNIYDENNTNYTKEEFLEKAKDVFSSGGRPFICFNHLNPYDKRLIKNMEEYI